MIELTRPGKDTLVIDCPVMPAAGTVGFDGAPYRDLVDLTKLGAIVTNPVTWKPRRVARGPRVVPLPAGVLIHTGLPNPGISKVVKQYAARWKRSPVPVIVHLVATSPADLAHAASMLDRVEGIAGIELGLHDQATPEEVDQLVGTVMDNTMRPILARVPLYNAVTLAQAAEDSGAGGVVVAAPPRGTTRDPVTGQLVGGRVYGPWLKAQALRAVGQVARAVNLPVTGSGGIHSPDDARDFIAAGAVAVQVDTAIWADPRQLEIIARNLGGLELTRVTGALSDEWEPGIGETMVRRRKHTYDTSSAPKIPLPRPEDLPEGDWD